MEHVKLVVVKIMDFFDVMLFSLVSRYRRFEITCAFHRKSVRMGLKKTEDRGTKSFDKRDACLPQDMSSRPTRL